VRLERTFPIDRALEALEESRTGHVRGKTVLLVNQGATNLASSKPKLLAEVVGSS
jgi:hypothetical protein